VLRGGFSTGALKAAGTLALVLWALHGVGLPFGEYVLAVLLVVLTTNLFNLLDLRPGRAAKGFLLLGTGILLLTWDTLALRMVGAFAGPLLVLGLFDMRERAMLGDTGSNVLGVLAGLWLVVSLDPLGQAIALGVVLALTVYGELRSISATVERVAVLRALDRLGRPKEPDGRDPQFARER
jgi:UDP-N-acetylmuramyl pentapeptide phosphotransferase/UDP-N-acetylglucosamine-1-phosphate transferase